MDIHGYVDIHASGGYGYGYSLYPYPRGLDIGYIHGYISIESPTYQPVNLTPSLAVYALPENATNALPAIRNY